MDCVRVMFLESDTQQYEYTGIGFQIQKKRSNWNAFF